MTRKRRIFRGPRYQLPSVVGEGYLLSDLEGRKYRNTAYKNARKSRNRPTRSEKRLEEILNEIKRGALKGRFITQFTVSNKWNIDFFFPEIRLGIEVDGSIHLRADQQLLDREKERTCEASDITLVRITNKEVWGDPQHLLRKLQEGWWDARSKIKRQGRCPRTFPRRTVNSRFTR